jgi:para-aminobenzoate synthetase
MWVERFVAYDHQAQQMYLCSVLPDDPAREAWFARMEEALKTLERIPTLKFISGAAPCVVPPLPLVSSRSKTGYLEDIRRIKEHLRSGDTYETCLTNEYKVQAEVDSFALYQVLRLTNPAPYAAYLQLPEVSILSSSPECFITIDPAGRIKSEPIKGTRAKGATPGETDLIRASLSASAKDHSELLMIVDLMRNDLSMCCRKGTVEVTDFMKITEYATVLQLSSTIAGRLRPNVGSIDVLKAIFPGGSVTGAPKYRTMQLIDRLERRPRGVYTGSIGYLSLDGAADFNIAIRTLVHHRQTHEISFGSGGAIVAESDPEGEYHETLVKAYALLRAVYLAKYGQFDNYRVEYESALPGKKSTPGTGSLQQYFAGQPELERIFRTSPHLAREEACLGLPV